MHLRILALKLLEALKQILYAVRQKPRRYLMQNTNLFACALTLTNVNVNDPRPAVSLVQIISQKGER